MTKKQEKQPEQQKPNDLLIPEDVLDRIRKMTPEVASSFRKRLRECLQAATLTIPIPQEFGSYEKAIRAQFSASVHYALIYTETMRELELSFDQHIKNYHSTK